MAYGLKASSCHPLTHPLQMREYPPQYASTDKNKKKSHYRSSSVAKVLTRKTRTI